MARRPTTTSCSRSPRDADPDEIKRAYRRLARELHPDANPGDPEAEARFKEVALAYETLSDPDRRQRYDRFGPEGAAGGMARAASVGAASATCSTPSSAATRSAVARRDRGVPTRGADLEAVIDLAFEEAVFGTQAPVTVRTAVACDDCEATGAAPGTQRHDLPRVRGRRSGATGPPVAARPDGHGQPVRLAAAAWAPYVETPCPTCHGEGRRSRPSAPTRSTSPLASTPAPRCGSPAAARSGPGVAGVGDLYVHVRVRPHDRFVRHGYDLGHELHLPMAQAALGAHLAFETLDGTEDLVIPRGTQTGRVFRLRGRGVPHVEGRGRGDLLVQVVVDTPTDLDRRAGGARSAQLRRVAGRRGRSARQRALRRRSARRFR